MNERIVFTASVLHCLGSMEGRDVCEVCDAKPACVCPWCAADVYPDYRLHRPSMCDELEKVDRGLLVCETVLNMYCMVCAHRLASVCDSNECIQAVVGGSPVVLTADGKSLGPRLMRLRTVKGRGSRKWAFVYVPYVATVRLAE